MTAITVEQALQAVRAYVASCAGVSLSLVRVGDVDAVATGSGVLYCAREIASTQPSAPQVVYGLGAGSTTSAQVQEQLALAWQVDGFGAGADLALRAVARRYVAGVPAGDALRAAGVHLFRVGTVVDMSRLQQSGTEPRWTMTLDAYIATVDTLSVVDTITQAVVNVTLERPDEVVSAFTVTVEP